jgi:uncharacterized protein YkwD
MLLLAAILAFTPATTVETIERDIYVITNAERAKYNLPALRMDPHLDVVARRHSADMLRRNYFSHTNPEGAEIRDRVELYDGEHRDFSALGENIWMASGASPAQIERIAGEIVTAWMNSKGHRANILAPGFELIGVGVAIFGGRIYATQDFGRLRPSRSR